MDNASGLIADAHTLLERGSHGRARSLAVLAQEELGKALWVYEIFEQAWNTGSEDALGVPRLRADGRRHAVKYMEAFVFGQELAAFWGDYESYEYPEDDSQEGWDAFFAKRTRDAEAAGKRANEEKMAGFGTTRTHRSSLGSRPSMGSPWATHRCAVGLRLLETRSSGTPYRGRPRGKTGTFSDHGYSGRNNGRSYFYVDLNYDQSGKNTNEHLRSRYRPSRETKSR